VLARVSGIDMGQGFRTVILQIAVEATRVSTGRNQVDYRRYTPHAETQLRHRRTADADMRKGCVTGG